jgi:hypothetical protein
LTLQVNRGRAMSKGSMGVGGTSYELVWITPAGLCLSYMTDGPACERHDYHRLQDRALAFRDLRSHNSFLAQWHLTTP